MAWNRAKPVGLSFFSGTQNEMFSRMRATADEDLIKEIKLFLFKPHSGMLKDSDCRSKAAHQQKNEFNIKHKCGN